jgi:hypothetical protein
VWGVQHADDGTWTVSITRRGQRSVHITGLTYGEAQDRRRELGQEAFTGD